MDINQSIEPGGSGKWMWFTLLMVVVAIGIGVWWYASRQEITPAPINNQETGALPSAGDADVYVLNTQSSSDDVASIDADLKATDLNNLDKELGDITSTVNQ